MTCYHPLKAMDLGLKSNGKKDIRIIKRSQIVDWYKDNAGNIRHDFLSIPCGRCIGCKLDYARQWSIRCCLESSFYDSNYFVTLTYDDINNPFKLVKDDLRYFIKKLRTYLSRDNKPEIRFFACGEYGSNTFRPHFHCIIFGLVLDDLKLYKRSSTGALYNSEFLSNIWSKGHVVVAEVNYHTCNYVARYIVKDKNNKDIVKYGFTPEFVLMSRRPGIGFGYYDSNLESIYKYDHVYFDFGDFNGSNPPKYFDKLLDKVNPDLLKKVKDKRKLKADISSILELSNTDIVSYDDYLKVKEIDKESKINWLRCRDV